MQMTCVIVDDDELSRNVLADFVAQAGFLNLVHTCSSAVEAYNILKSEKIDLVLLDIEMPTMSGLELLRNLDRRPQVILVTSKQEYALESYDYDVTDYLLKPVNYARFLKAVSRARDYSEAVTGKSSSGDADIFVKVDSLLVKIKVKDISLVEAMGNYVVITTPKDKYTVHTTLTEIENKLPAQDFMRIHRSYVIRLDKVEKIEDTVLVVEKKILPIGKTYREEFMKRLNRI